MLRITVEIVPFGIEARKRVIQKLEIWNDATGTKEVGNYCAHLEAEYGSRYGRLTGFRRHKQSVWTLIGGFLKLWGHTKHSPKLLLELQDDPRSETLRHVKKEFLDELQALEQSGLLKDKDQSTTDTQ